MKIALPIDSSQSLGGGFSFRKNLIKGMHRIEGAEYVDSIEKADVCLVSGTTMVNKETITKIKDLKKKLVVRVDNVPRNSRNRNTGISRLVSFTEQADGIVWQSNWCKEYLGDLVNKTNKPEITIVNGVDTDIFRPEGRHLNIGDKENIYFYSRFNRDETKNWEKAWYEFQMIHKKNPNAILLLVGRWSNEQVQYNFDFFRGERYQYLGVVDNLNFMAEILRSASKFLATYYNDACSNTYIEALMCGQELVCVDESGGTPEIMALYNEYKRGNIENPFTLEAMSDSYLSFFEKLN